jgi:siderophore synthetase component
MKDILDKPIANRDLKSTSCNEIRTSNIAPAKIIIRDIECNNDNENADHYSIMALLNCYIREVAIPNSTFTMTQTIKDNKKYFYVLLDIESYEVSFIVEKPSLSSFFNVSSNVVVTDRNGNIDPIDYLTLLMLINHQLSQINKAPFNFEIMGQAKNSFENIGIFLKHTNPKPNSKFMDSEQNLIFGHEFHPTPKSRYGLTQDSLLKISPELNSTFKLHYFKVPKHLLKCFPEGSTNKPPEALIDKGDHLLYPLHPWQAQYILNKKSLCDFLKSVDIYSIGPFGNEFIPSSSVRTLYHHANDYFYKFSLHLRLTNCFRKNSIYELKSAVQLSAIIKKQNLTQFHEKISVLEEPLSYTLNLDAENNDSVLIQEIFGLILRDNIEQIHQKQSYVALKLFSRQTKINSQIEIILNQITRQKNISYRNCAIDWFKLYVEILLPFIFDSYLKNGIVFEPHLQNIVINLADNKPSHIYIRDLEGTKLCLHHYINGQFSHIDKEDLYSIIYTPEQSFKRIVYCLIFNNFATAIHYISSSDFDLEKDLWSELRNIIGIYKSNHPDNGFIQQQVDQLLNSKFLPYKANLITRFLKSADKNAVYTELPNPFYNEINPNT